MADETIPEAERAADDALPTGGGPAQEIDVADHPLRRIVLLGVILLLAGAVVIFGRPASEDPQLALAPHLGSVGTILFRTDPGAAPDDREWLRDVLLIGFAERGEIPVLEVTFSGQVTVHGGDGDARIPIPVERLLEVYIDDEPIFRRVE